MAPNNTNDKSMFDAARDYIHDATKSESQKQAEIDMNKDPKDLLNEKLPDTFQEAGVRIGATLDRGVEDYQAISDGQPANRIEREKQDMGKVDSLIDSVKEKLSGTREDIHQATRSPEQKEWDNMGPGDRLKDTLKNVTGSAIEGLGNTKLQSDAKAEELRKDAVNTAATKKDEAVETVKEKNEKFESTMVNMERSVGDAVRNFAGSKEDAAQVRYQEDKVPTAAVL